MNIDFTKGSIVKQIWIFTIPLLIGNMFQQMYQLVDTAVLGKMVSYQAQAAAGTSTPISFFLTAILAGFIMGSSVIISQNFGAKDDKNFHKGLSTSFIVVFALAFLMTVCGVFGAEFILKMLNTPDNILPLAKIYLQIFSASIPFQCLYQYYAGVLRAIGDSKTPLYFLIMSSVLNIILDVAFVMMFENGVVAVAVATFIAQAVAAICCVIYTFRKYDILKITPKNMVFDKPLFSLIIKYGVPSSIQQIVNSLGMMFLQGVVNGFGDYAISAYSAAYRIDNFIVLPIMSLSLALANFVGQNIGAKQEERASEGLFAVMKVSVIFCAISSFLIFVFAEWLMGIFVDATQPEIIRLGSDCLRVLAVPFVMSAVLNAYISFFRGYGDVKGAMAITTSQIIIRVAFAYLLAPIPFIGINAVWYCMPFTWIVCSIAAYFRYKRGTYKKYNRFAQKAS